MFLFSILQEMFACCYTDGMKLQHIPSAILLLFGMKDGCEPSTSVRGRQMRCVTHTFSKSAVNTEAVSSLSQIVFLLIAIISHSHSVAIATQKIHNKGYLLLDAYSVAVKKINVTDCLLQLRGECCTVVLREWLCCEHPQKHYTMTDNWTLILQRSHIFFSLGPPVPTPESAKLGNYWHCFRLFHVPRGAFSTLFLW